MESHVETGNIQSSSFNDIIWKGVVEYHEDFGGTGDPLKLKGEEISLVGRTLWILDAYDAIRSERAYKNSNCYETTMRKMLHPTDDKVRFDPNLLFKFFSFIESRGTDVYYVLNDVDIQTSKLLYNMDTQFNWLEFIKWNLKI